MWIWGQRPRKKMGEVGHKYVIEKFSIEFKRLMCVFMCIDFVA